MKKKKMMNRKGGNQMNFICGCYDFIDKSPRIPPGKFYKWETLPIKLKWCKIK